MPLKPSYKGYLFDLDGTLLDSAPDIGAALNHALASIALPPSPTALIRHWVGHGSRTLIREALQHHERYIDAEQVEGLLPLFLDYYKSHLADQSELYPTVLTTLTTLRDCGYRLAVVTNKLAELTHPLLQEIGLSDYFDLIVSGDTAAKSKPAPEPILLCLEKFELSSAEVLMVGDSGTDVGAAKAANVDVACLRDGYNHGVNVVDLAPTAVIDQLAEVLPSQR
ncbi:MAG TPA: phosphoglycolate phosphatase [Gammaproteobacteria bacterium]|nr:phosphoglycolate phosphatase [Gammaproteobacteria bacterium]